MLTSNKIFSLGLGVAFIWKLVDQRLDTDITPNELQLKIEPPREALFYCI